MVQDIKGLGIKTIDYSYDPVSGQVVRVDYQRQNGTERFIHQYTYDEDDYSLVKVETSTDAINFTENASYTYYENGSLKRTVLEKGLQGIDYVYNLQGALKSINHPSLTASNDPGGDSDDVFGMNLHYYQGDYTRTNTPKPVPTIKSGIDQYNGNIKAITWNIRNQNGTVPDSYYYKYDRNNWLEGASFNKPLGTIEGVKATEIRNKALSVSETVEATESISLQPGFQFTAGSNRKFVAKINTGTDIDTNGAYNVSEITYDANGNIQSLNRNKNSVDGNTRMDRLSYQYKTDKPNQLLRVDDAVGSVSDADDIEDQEGENYVYNALGQLIENKGEQITYFYNTSGLVTEIRKNNVPLVKFFYNDKGHRVRKESYRPDTGALQHKEHYIRDVSGTVMAIYRNTSIQEYPVYGISRLGMYRRNTSKTTYQLTDHLGNVRALVEKGSTQPKGATDYYPFGMPMPNRNVEGQYRYAYQGQEKDAETGMEAFQLRLWDARIGRWLTTDPYGQYSSPYLGMGNNPINGIDPDGGLFGRIRAWAHKLFNGGEIFKNDYDQWVWSSGSGEITGNMTNGFALDIGESRNFGYGGLGKLVTNSSSIAVSGEYNVGILNHGLDVGLIGLELNANTTLGSFSYGTQVKNGQWSQINESFVSNYRDKYAQKRTTDGFSIETPYGDGSFNVKGVKPSGKGSKWQTANEIKAGYAILGLQFHKLTSKGLDFDFSVQEDVGLQFFLGGSLDVNIQSSYQWKF